MPDSGSFATTERSRVRRHPERAHYDRDTVHAILDAALMCHVGYVIDDKPYVTPTLYWRDGERLYWHGSSTSRMLRAQREDVPVCLTVSHIDGLVLGRCAFRHSLNYRAVMVFGTAQAIEDEREKAAGLNGFIERLYPGRTRHIHVKVQPSGGRVLTTQLYFPGEQQNRSDDLFRRALLMRTAKNAGWLAGRFDFVID